MVIRLDRKLQDTTLGLDGDGGVECWNGGYDVPGFKCIHTLANTVHGKNSPCTLFVTVLLRSRLTCVVPPVGGIPVRERGSR